MKRPSFQFYPSDWLRDTALRSCSTGARGLWMDMLCFMHEGNPYGHMKVGDKVIHASNLARMVGEPLEVIEEWLRELEQAHVFGRAEDGAMFSRRMVRDEYLRAVRAECGKLGGNPALKKAAQDKGEDGEKDKQNPTPSSSSSSSRVSSSLRSEEERAPRSRSTCSKPIDVSDEVWESFLALRRAKKAPVTATALAGLRREADKAGLTLQQALEQCCARGWTGFKADWVKDDKGLTKRGEAAQSLLRGLTSGVLGGAGNVKFIG